MEKGICKFCGQPIYQPLLEEYRKNEEGRVKDYLKNLDWQTWVEIEKEVNENQFPGFYEEK